MPQEHSTTTANPPRWLWLGLLALWALLFLPGLRTNPNWYGDEGEWMEKCWTFIHGTPRVGPITDDFIFPYPYPPLYMLFNGGLLRTFGYDMVVGRAFGAVTALAAAAVLVWIGTRLRNRTFGFLCAAALLVYSEANVNFRWVRSHPLAGTLALASVGFLICYVQEKRLRDALGAGLFCALATATNYFTYPLIGAVAITVAGVNWRDWKTARAWRDIAVAGGLAGAYAGGFVLWYCARHGHAQLLAEVGRLTSMAESNAHATIIGELGRFCDNVWALGFHTPTHQGPRGWEGHDWWLTVATIGFVCLPVTNKKWLRVWLPFWLVALMYGGVGKRDNVPLYFYPAMIFLPLMAVGFAGVLEWAGELVARVDGRWRRVPAMVGLGLLAVPSLQGAWSHFETKIDPWTQGSVAEAEGALQYVNEHTTTNDFVLVPKQIYWLVKNADKKSMLSHCVTIEGRTNDAWPVPIPPEFFWFDCRWQNAKYLVLASGVTTTGQPRGIDLIYTRGLAGVPEVIAGMLKEHWPVVYTGGHQFALVNIEGGRQWPVAVDGEYLVLANPRYAKETK